MTTKDKDSWLDFTLSFLNIAKFPFENISDKQAEGDIRKIVDEFYIASIFNIKHGLESFIKSMIVMMEGRELEKQIRHHDIMKNLDYLFNLFKNTKFIETMKEEAEKHEEEEAYKYINKRIEDLPEMIRESTKLISNYYHLSFLKEKISNDYSIEDSDNTAFKYPQNDLTIKLDYSQILTRVTKKDLITIARDAAILEYIITSFWLICIAYLEKERAII